MRRNLVPSLPCALLLGALLAAQAAGQTCLSDFKAGEFSKSYCLSTIKAKCFNQCAIDCRNDGYCLFGCSVGQDFDSNRCETNCAEYGAACLTSCLKTIECISGDCGDVTLGVTIVHGAIVYNRLTQRWQQTVLITNNTCVPITKPVYYLASLSPGWTLTNGIVNTAYAAPLKEIPTTIDPLGMVSLTLEFTRTGTTAFSYTPRVSGGTVASTTTGN
jgi:hypothetical protein